MQPVSQNAPELALERRTGKSSRPRRGRGGARSSHERKRRTFSRRVQGAGVPKRPQNRIRRVSDRMGRCGRANGDGASRTGASLRHAGTLAGTPGEPNQAMFSPAGARAGTFAGTPGGFAGRVTGLRAARGTVRGNVPGRAGCPLPITARAGEGLGESSRGRSLAVNESGVPKRPLLGLCPTYGSSRAQRNRRRREGAAFRCM